jgi:two-component system sensor histidine kinase ChvG
VKGRLAAFASRISVRILAFNLLIVFLPLAGVLSLGTYERQLLKSLEHALVQQGRLLAAALRDSGPSLQSDALRTLRAMKRQQDARIRVVDASGVLLADSSALPPDEPAYPSEAGAPDGRGSGSTDARETLLYRAALLPVRVYRRYFRPPSPPLDSADYYSGARVLDGPEIKAALSGRYGAMTRISAAGQRSVTLYSALPVMDGEKSAGAVLVSQSTYRILTDLYALRLDIFALFLYSVATAAVLSLLVSATITVPLRRLRDQAELLVDGRGRFRGSFVPSKRRDEIGDLSRRLGELTARLERQVRLAESFASDVSHEFKNPLASIRSAAELAQTNPDPDKRAGFLGLVLDDVARLERLLTGVREISMLDAGAAEEPALPVDVKAVAEGLLEGMRARGTAAGVKLSVTGEPLFVAVPAERLLRMLGNLVENAVSFSPPAGEVEVRVLREGNTAVIVVEDQGPGVPAEHLERVFERFFSFRPSDGRLARHSGLGLSIVKAIAEGCGGRVRAGPSALGGAAFEVRLPIAKPRE